MKRNDKHIDKFLRDPLPEPEIRADDAWAGMSDMLDATANDEMNSVKWPAQFWKSLGSFKGLFIAFSAVVAVSAVIALIVFNSNKAEYRQIAPSGIPSEHRNTTDVGNANPVTEQTKTAKYRANTAVDRDASSETDRAKIGTGSSESSVNGNHPEQKASELITARRIESKLKTPDHAGPAHVSSYTRRRNAHSSAAPERNARIHKVDDQPDISSPNTLARSENAGSAQKPTEFSVVNRANTTSVSHEKTSSAPPAGSLLNSLEPLRGHFMGSPSDLGKLVRKPVLNEAQPKPKEQKSIFTNLHFGPEWNITRSVVSTNYMLTGADSAKHPLRLAIPGVFVSKSWDRHTATFIFNPLHSYFGDKERVGQRVDSIATADSTYREIYRNTNFIKAFGLNFSLQYQFQVTRGLSLVGGLSYARYSSALFRKETDYANGTILDGSYLTARGQDALRSYINPEQWSLRVGILFYSRTVFNNRLQTGLTTIIPLSNLSLGGFKSVKSPNFQMSIRFLIR